MVIPVISALGGAFIGAYISGQNQKKLLIEQQKKENKLKTLEACNAFLDIAGTKVLTIEIGGPKQTLDFDNRTYENTVRPVLFQHLHYYPKSVTEIVYSIDSDLQTYYYIEGADVEDLDITASKYNRLVQEIKNVISNYQTYK
ncbi:hypothetical protein [Shouchella clausii]|uniref:hypothetical protein n=1 Tax=Shouchella clausii TaxID=79880 RepID=UPI000B95F739|nr:hypothetical protein [Shouchella clausii]AST97305.1 hypothetical protein BC8716_15620 [Shouchella clausii]MCR1287864.1 hypothetical protein [Shouchella clausii]MCY1106460.1 hypothetical protein [Shouchella clausii]MEB5473210.1 hypothetical protein [Shouchella clausii]QNM43661.1 hypothetical protein DUT88_12485 [Shouchella clausii]